MSSLPPVVHRPAVLLVEDDPTNQLIALSMLRHLGIEADAASDGEAGVRMASERAYDVVLMDVEMPVMDGVEAMKAIRSRLPSERCPRIVAVTAHAVAGTREQMLAAGFDGFYSKPLSVALLEEAVAPPAASAPGLVARPPSEADEAAAAEALVGAVRAHVRALLGEDDEAFVTELAESFAASASESVRDAAAARASGDADGVASAAHALKGSASNVGLDRLTEAWDAIETGVRRGDAAVLAAPLAEALAETERTIGRLANVAQG